MCAVALSFYLPPLPRTLHAPARLCRRSHSARGLYSPRTVAGGCRAATPQQTPNCHSRLYMDYLPSAIRTRVTPVAPRLAWTAFDMLPHAHISILPLPAAPRYCAPPPARLDELATTAAYYLPRVLPDAFHPRDCMCAAVLWFAHGDMRGLYLCRSLPLAFVLADSVVHTAACGWFHLRLCSPADAQAPRWPGSIPILPLPSAFPSTHSSAMLP